jgi:hypothetical protein
MQVFHLVEVCAEGDSKKKKETKRREKARKMHPLSIGPTHLS